MDKIEISGKCDSKFSEIERIFSESLQSGFDTGASIAIEHNGEMLVNLWGGHKDLSRTEPWLEDTIINVFSTTKAVTATCIIKLVDEGRLDLNKKVSDYWPEYACNGKEGTKVSDFLCHRAGMFGFQGRFPDIEFSDWHGWVKTLEKQAPFRDPGSSQGYHALTFGWLAGEILRRVDGRSVGQFFEEEIAQRFSIDFKIGLEDKELSRCADILVDPRPNIRMFEILRFLPDFVLPTELKLIKQILKGGDFERAFEGRIDNADYANTDEWRKAEIPSANGHGTAESLAKLFGILSTGCERDGKKLISESTLKRSLKPLSKGPDTVLFGADINFGVGYDIGLGLTTIGTEKHASTLFGHCGIGGSVAFGDIENSIGYAFLCNRMHRPQDLYKTSNLLTKTLYELI